LLSEIVTVARRRAAIGAMMSMSRSMVAFLVMSPTGWLNSAQTSRIDRVMRSSRSMGWYASVLTPIAMTLHR